MITDRDIVVLSSVEWDYLWQGQHEIATRLAVAGNRVLLIENMGIRSPRPSEADRISRRIRSRFRSLPSGGVARVAPNLHVYSPVVLPPFGSRRRWVNRRLLLPTVERAARRLCMRDPIVWAFLPTDTVLDLRELLRSPASVCVYSCSADFGELTPHPAALRRAEVELLRSSDIVFAEGSRLTAHCARWAGEVHQVHCAVGLESFRFPDHDARDAAPVGAETSGERHPSEMRHPIIGYVGTLHRHLDVGLAAWIARARPSWSFVYVGPAQIPTDELSQLPNVRLVGHVPHESVAGYIEQFDVGIVPYRLGAQTETVFPTKLNEYLAMGKPVVSTALPEVREFNARHGVVRTPGNDPAEFLAAIEAELSEPENGRTAARREAAETHAWAPQLERMSELIAAKDPRSSAPPPARP